MKNKTLFFLIVAGILASPLMCGTSDVVNASECAGEVLSVPAAVFGGDRPSSFWFESDGGARELLGAPTTGGGNYRFCVPGKGTLLFEKPALVS